MSNGLDFFLVCKIRRRFFLLLLNLVKYQPLRLHGKVNVHHILLWNVVYLVNGSAGTELWTRMTSLQKNSGAGCGDLDVAQAKLLGVCICLSHRSSFREI